MLCGTAKGLCGAEQGLWIMKTTLLLEGGWVRFRKIVDRYRHKMVLSRLP